MTHPDLPGAADHLPPSRRASVAHPSVPGSEDKAFQSGGICPFTQVPQPVPSQPQRIRIKGTLGIT